jgi:hypothetical protein
VATKPGVATVIGQVKTGGAVLSSGQKAIQGATPRGAVTIAPNSVTAPNAGLRGGQQIPGTAQYSVTRDPAAAVPTPPSVNPVAPGIAGTIPGAVNAPTAPAPQEPTQTQPGGPPGSPVGNQGQDPSE